jgi:hypothetical protein
MAATSVDRVFEEFRQLVDLLDERSELSLRSYADETFRKALLLAAASHFERVVTECIETFVAEVSNRHVGVCAFVKNKALSRQYHTLFDWDAENASKFFGLFGDTFRTAMRDRMKNDEEFSDSVKAFLELGRERNRLVHQDFATFTLEKTANEIYEAYRRAATFVAGLPEHLRASDCAANSATAPADICGQSIGQRNG